MAKYDLKLKARKLRRHGVSIKRIAEDLKVSKSSVSLWVRDIVLSTEQLEILKNSMLKGAEIGRFKSARIQKEKRLKIIEDSKKAGIIELSKLRKREFLLTGLALYWGEGSKKSDEFSFCNSDPEMIKFFVFWLQKCFNVRTQDLKCSIGINEIHIKREAIVREYWSRILGINLNQFTKTSFKRTKNKKIYENFNDHYGTLRIRVRKSIHLYIKIIGLIEGLKYNMSG